MKVLLLLCAAACSAQAAMIAEASCSITHVPTGTTVASESYNSLPSSMCDVESPAMRVIVSQFGDDYPWLRASGPYFAAGGPVGFMIWLQGPHDDCGDGGFSAPCYEWSGHVRYLERTVAGVIVTGGRGTGWLRREGGYEGGDLNGSALTHPFAATARITSEPPLAFTYGRRFNVGFELFAEITALGNTLFVDDFASYYNTYSWGWQVVDENGEPVENAVVTFVEPIPEPGTWLLMGAGLLALACSKRS